MSAHLSTILTFLCFLPAVYLSAQSAHCKPEITLVDVEVSKDAAYVGMRILARDRDCGPMVNLGRQDIVVTERIGRGEARAVEVVQMTPEERYDTSDLRRDSIEVLFLVDVSARSQVPASAEMIANFLSKHRGANATYTLRTFDERLAAPQALNSEAPSPVLNRLRATTRQPHLHGALIETLHELGERDKKQLVFLFSRGVNVDPDYGDAPRLPPRKADVLREVESLGDNIYLFTVATSPETPVEDGPGGDAGAEQGLMSELPRKTLRPDDGYAVGRLPDAVEAIFDGNRKLLSTHLLDVRTTDPKFIGRERMYTVTEAGNSEAKVSMLPVSKGSFNDPIHLGLPSRPRDYLLPTLIGVAGVAVMLAVFYFLIPALRRRKFRSSHVEPYRPEPGRQVLDPMTREPIRPGEPVVNVCSMVVPLQTWRDCGDQCPHYPGCTNNNLQCDGSGRGQSLNFFALHGVNRRLNWIWFGTLGGFTGWVFYALLNGFGGPAIGELVNGFTDYDNAETLVRDALLGACFGFGLTLLLAVMAERSESRRISFRRIAGRTLLGGLLATLAFVGGFLLLETGIIARPVAAAAISWIAFGLALGLVLSLRSSIEIRRGLLGGLLAGLAGFGVYTLLGNLWSSDLEAKVVSLLVTGAVLGFVLDTVVKLAENYEIEYVAPSNYRRTVPLSKWLKSEWAIIIGTQPGSQVYIKWPDEEVLPEHAQIRLDGGRVYLVPQGETLINGRIISDQKRTQLENGDLIQLGRRGLTQMRFWQR